MGGYAQQIGDLVAQVEHAESEDERRAALDELEIVAELAHAEHDRALEAAARDALAGVGA